jgi:hypothetical protein
LVLGAARGGAPCRLLAGRGRSSITCRPATARPAAITVLLLCLQLKQFNLSVALVFCFSIGLALTMVTAAIIAALIMPHLSNHWRRVRVTCTLPLERRHPLHHYCLSAGKDCMHCPRPGAI